MKRHALLSYLHHALLVMFSLAFFSFGNRAAPVLAQATIAGISEKGLGEETERDFKLVDTYIKYRKGHVEVGWTTKGQGDIVGFQLERRMATGSDIAPGSVGTVTDWEVVRYLKRYDEKGRQGTYSIVDSMAMDPVSYDPVNLGEPTPLQYRLAQVRPDGSLADEEILSIAVLPPAEFSARSYKQPSTTIATIEYNIPRRTRVQIKVYDTTQQFEETLLNEIVDPGRYKAYFDGAERRSGLYVYHISAGEELWIEPLMLVK